MMTFDHHDHDADVGADDDDDEDGDDGDVLSLSSCAAPAAAKAWRGRKGSPGQRRQRPFRERTKQVRPPGRFTARGRFSVRRQTQVHRAWRGRPQLPVSWWCSLLAFDLIMASGALLSLRLLLLIKIGWAMYRVYSL